MTLEKKTEEEFKEQYGKKFMEEIKQLRHYLATDKDLEYQVASRMQRRVQFLTEVYKEIAGRDYNSMIAPEEFV